MLNPIRNSARRRSRKGATSIEYPLALFAVASFAFIVMQMVSVGNDQFKTVAEHTQSASQSEQIPLDSSRLQVSGELTQAARGYTDEAFALLFLGAVGSFAFVMKKF